MKGLDWDTLPAIFGVATLKEFMRVGTKAAYEMTRIEGFPAIRIGRTIRISRDGLRAWHDQQFGLTEEPQDKAGGFRLVE